ncbi:MAG TPA: hypothetical protein VF405_09725 [Gammaproteobacteria bacterium]
MRFAIAVLVALMAVTAPQVQAQGRGGSTGPFTGYEADQLSDVWSQIRVAAHFEDINWRTHGLSRAPGSPEAQRILSENWNQLRREERFEDIDWDRYADSRYSDSRSARSGRGASTGPFTGYEAEQLSDVWREIRAAAHFEDINWRTHGLQRAPGSPEAQRILSDNWDELRREERFEDIDWDRYADSRYSDTRSARSSRTERYGRADRGSADEEGGYRNTPYSREDFEEMSRLWGRIREAARFEDINWRGMGLSGPPGGYEARRLTSRFWGELRKAANFEDINWQKTTGYRAR